MEELKQIEKELYKLFPDSVSSDTDQQNEWIRQASGELLSPLSREQLLEILEPGKVLLERGGKRWRPLLMLLSCELCGGGSRALPLTPLVEIPHNGSLIIDDIEDNSRERRGGPALHLSFGVDMAINTGNLMYFLASSIVERCSLDDREKLTIYRFYNEDLRRLHLGQGIDILWHRDHAYVPSVAEYLQMCRLKTGSMARLAARIGVVAGRGDPDLANQMGSLAEDFGVAFQIKDDTRNLREGVPGKQRGDDIIEGKKSLPLILYLQTHPDKKEEVGELFRSVRDKTAGQAVDEIEEMIRRLTVSGCLENAENQALSLLNSALQDLQDLFPHSTARQNLQELISTLIET